MSYPFPLRENDSHNYESLSAQFSQFSLQAVPGRHPQPSHRTRPHQPDELNRLAHQFGLTSLADSPSNEADEPNSQPPRYRRRSTLRRPSTSSSSECVSASSASSLSASSVAVAHAQSGEPLPRQSARVRDAAARVEQAPSSTPSNPAASESGRSTPLSWDGDEGISMNDDEDQDHAGEGLSDELLLYRRHISLTGEDWVDRPVRVRRSTKMRRRRP